MAAMMSAESRRVVERVLADEADEGGRLRLATEMTGGAANFRVEAGQALAMLRELQQGVAERTEEAGL